MHDRLKPSEQTANLEISTLETHFTRTIQELGERIPEVAEQEAIIAERGAELIDVLQIDKGFFAQTTPDHIAFAGLALHLEEAAQLEKTDPEAAATAVEFVIDTTRLLARSHAAGFDELRAEKDERTDEEQIAAIMAHVNPELTEALARQVQDNNPFASTRQHMLLTQETEIIPTIFAMDFDFPSDRQPSSPELAANLQAFREQSGWKRSFGGATLPIEDGRVYVILPHTVAQTLAYPEHAEQLLLSNAHALLNHEYVHCQTNRLDFGPTQGLLEELRAEYFSGDRSYTEYELVDRALFLMEGYRLGDDLYNAQAEGDNMLVHTNLANHFGLINTLRLLTIYGNHYVADGATEQRVSKYIGAFDDFFRDMHHTRSSPEIDRHIHDRISRTGGGAKIFKKYDFPYMAELIILVTREKKQKKLSNETFYSSSR